jgi:hypothetical protein
MFEIATPLTAAALFVHRDRAELPSLTFFVRVTFGIPRRARRPSRRATPAIRAMSM